jgi:hypothetical protein
MKDYPPPTGIFKWGPKIPGHPRRQLNKQEMDIFNEKLQAAAKEYRLKQAIALHEAINRQDLPMVDSSIHRYHEGKLAKNEKKSAGVMPGIPVCPNITNERVSNSDAVGRPAMKSASCSAL